MNRAAPVSDAASARPEIDRDALLAALVLAPATFARNRFFALFNEPWAAKARARAGQLRVMVRHLTNDDGVGPATVLELVESGSGRTTLRYEVPAMHLLRTALLEPLELALLRFALMRRAQAGTAVPLAKSLQMIDDDRALVEGALAKLSRELTPGGV
jgi:hypothetical protein